MMGFISSIQRLRNTVKAQQYRLGLNLNVFILYYLVHDRERLKWYTFSLSAVVIRLQYWHCCSLKLHSSTRCRDKCSLSTRTPQLGCMHSTFAYGHFASWSWNDEVKCLAFGHADAIRTSLLSNVEKKFWYKHYIQKTHGYFEVWSSSLYIPTMKRKRGIDAPPICLILLWILLEIACQTWLPKLLAFMH